jgi:cell division protein FtsW (lipid II flippase)
MIELAAWLASLPLSQALRKLNWLVPWLQIIHILANGLVLAAVVMIDLRIWGISRSQVTSALARRFRSWIWVALVVLTVSGIALILYAPRRQLVDPTFQVKMVIMGFAIVATVALQLMLRPDAETLQEKPGRRTLAGVLATLTLVLWVGVTFAGRGRWLTLMLMR